MGQGKWEVEFYVARDGSSPVTEFLDSLTAREYHSVDQAIARLAMYGRDLDRPHVDYLRDQIWELRVRTGKVRYRLLYFFFDGRRFVITHGIKKDTAKVPNKEIERALACRNDYLARQARR